MTAETATPWFTGVKKKYGLGIAAVLAICVFGVAYFVCALQYAGTKKELLEMQKDELAAWVAGTSEAVSLWAEALDAQAKRVSSAELYRMFAADVEQLGGDAADVVNDPEAAKNAPEGLASLSEQVPLMRNLLLDFMNFNGLSDARIVNTRGQTLLSALTRPSPVNENQRRAVEQAVASGKLAFGPVRASQAGLVIDVADPLRAVLAQNNSDAPVAALLLSKPVTGDLAQFLARDLRQADVARPHLVQRRGDALEEILVRGSAPLTLGKELLPFTKAGALPFARRTGLNGSPVYSLGDKIPGLDWWLVLEVPAAVVDARLRTQAWMIFGIGGLISLGVVLLFALLWWIVVGHEQRAVAQRFEALYKIIKQQKQLLDSVNVSLDVGLLLTDTDGRIQICNRAFARIVRREEAELPGMNVQSAFEASACGRLLDGVRSVAAAGESASLELSLPGGAGERLFRVTLFPFAETDGEAPTGAVAIFQDITEFRRASERRRRQQINTIAALVRAVESVDPYLAGRSRMMGRLTDLMGPYLPLDERDRETIRTAASLSQMSKLFVPRELIIKAGKYTPEEQKLLHRSPDYAYNVLRDVGFELPVPRAVHEMSERMDGTGYPQRLRGEEISVHARVLAVANAFCALVSPRSYRTGMAPGEAVEKLRADANSFDRRVVDALDAVLRTPEGKLALTRTGGEENAA